MYQTIPTFMPNAGIVLNAPQEFLPANVSVFSRNMEYFNQLLQGRLGLSKLDSAALPGPISRQYDFKVGGSIFYMFFCTTDIAYYDFSALKFVYLTPIYTTGTIAISGTAVTGSGTSWAANLKPGDYIKAGSGNIDSNATWHKISTVTDDTHLVLATSGGTVGSGSNYVARQTFSGDTGNPWFCKPFVDNAKGDIIVATNGNDGPIWWDGNGQVKFLPASGSGNYIFTITIGSATVGAVYSDGGQNFTVLTTVSSGTTLRTNGTGDPLDGTLTKVSGTGDDTISYTSFTLDLPLGFVCKYINVYKNRLIFLWNIEGGLDNKRRIRWCDVANAFSWQPIDFTDLLDEDTEIRGTCIFDDFLMVGKEKEWYIGQPSASTFVFNFNKSSTAEGLKSQGSVIVRKDYVYYYGFDKKFHRWNILRDEILTEEIFLDTQNFDPNLEQFIEGCDFYNKNQIRWFCPSSSNSGFNDYTVVFDYLYHKLNVWDCPNLNAQMCMGSYILQSSLFDDDAVWGNYYLDEQVGYWDDVNYLANAPQFLYCGYDGIVRKADTGIDDDGSTYTRLFRAIRNNYGMPDFIKRLYKQQFWFVEDPVASITVKLKKDDGASYDSSVFTLSLSDPTRDIVKQFITWDKEAENFQIELSATTFFATLGWFSYVMKKRRVNN